MANALVANADREHRELKAKHEELLKLYRKHFPKVDRGLLQDLIENTPSAVENGGRLYELQIITKKGTDPEKIRSFFVNRSGRVPASREGDTHYHILEYATLDLIKQIQNLDETEHIMGDYTFGSYAFSQVHRHRPRDESEGITKT